MSRRLLRLWPRCTTSAPRGLEQRGSSALIAASRPSKGCRAYSSAASWLRLAGLRESPCAAAALRFSAAHVAASARHAGRLRTLIATLGEDPPACMVTPRPGVSRSPARVSRRKWLSDCSGSSARQGCCGQRPPGSDDAASSRARRSSVKRRSAPPRKGLQRARGYQHLARRCSRRARSHPSPRCYCRTSPNERAAAFFSHSAVAPGLEPIQAAIRRTEASGPHLGLERLNEVIRDYAAGPYWRPATAGAWCCGRRTRISRPRPTGRAASDVEVRECDQGIRRLIRTRHRGCIDREPCDPKITRAFATAGALKLDRPLVPRRADGTRSDAIGLARGTFVAGPGASACQCRRPARSTTRRACAC